MDNNENSENPVTRRRFIAGLAVGGLGLMLPWKFGEAFAGDGPRGDAATPNGDNPLDPRKQVDAMRNFRFDKGTEKEIPYCVYSFDSVNGLGVEYKTEVRGEPGKIIYTISGLPLRHIYQNTGREDRTKSYFRTAIAVDPRSYFRSTGEEVKKANQFIAATGAFLYASHIVMYPTFIERENATPRNIDGLGVFSQIISTGYNYDVRFSCHSGDAVVFDEIVEQRPSYKPARDDYYINATGIFDTWGIRHSDETFIPEVMLPSETSIVSLTYINKGVVKDAPSFARESIQISN